MCVCDVLLIQSCSYVVCLVAGRSRSLIECDIVSPRKFLFDNTQKHIATRNLILNEADFEIVPGLGYSDSFSFFVVLCTDGEFLCTDAELLTVALREPSRKRNGSRATPRWL